MGRITTWRVLDHCNYNDLCSRSFERNSVWVPFDGHASHLWILRIRTLGRGEAGRKSTESVVCRYINHEHKMFAMNESLHANWSLKWQQMYQCISYTMIDVTGSAILYRCLMWPIAHQTPERSIGRRSVGMVLLYPDGRHVKEASGVLKLPCLSISNRFSTWMHVDANKRRGFRQISIRSSKS